MPDSTQGVPMSQTGSKIADAIQNVATATDKSADTGAMGIKGVVLNNIGNMAAMAIIAAMLIYLQREQVAQSREKDVVFTEAMKTINEGAEKRFDRSEATHGKALDRLIASSEKSVSALEATNVIMTRASDEMKDLSKEVKTLIKTVSAKNPNP